MAVATAPLHVCIVGGSIAGLAAALSFLRLGCTVRVFEKSPTPFHGRGGSIGYVNNPSWEQLRGGAPMMRRGARASRAQGAYLYGDLWGYLFAGLPPGTVAFDSSVEDLGDPAAPTVLGVPCDLCILADGGWSALRDRYFAPHLRPARPEYAGYNVWRFRVERKHVPGWDAEGQYSDGRHSQTILMHIAQNDGRDFLMGGTAIAAPEGALAPPEAGASRQVFGDGGGGGGGGEAAAAAAAAADAPPPWYLPWFKEHFGAHAGGELLRCQKAAAEHGKITAQPQYEFGASRIVLGRLVLMGDAAHMASPRTGAGAHTAVLDGLAMFAALAAALKFEERGDRLAERLLALYEPAALHRAADLFARSKEASAPVTAPGWQRKEL